MTTQARLEPAAKETDPEKISRYLRDNPDFFDGHPDLVAELRLSHSSGKAVSLVERQIQVLRDQNNTLKARLRELIDVAHDNDHLNQRMHEMTLGLLKARSTGELMDTLEDHLRNEFNSDSIAAHLVAADEVTERETIAVRLGAADVARELFVAAFQHGKPQCGRLSEQQLEFLFHEQAGSIQSAVVVPLGAHAEHGLLAIGNREAERFSSGMDTLFMTHLGELLAAFLQNHQVADTDARG
jgi:uncharacterized protein YigA (DUF484 family)